MAVSAVALGAPLAGCGGGDRQDANEPSGTYKVEVIGASFPSHQSIAQKSEMTLSVRNADTRTIPDLTVTVNSFGSVAGDTRLADEDRPVWIVDHDPSRARSTYTNTWSSGPLRPGEERTLTWRVTAVQTGAHELHYQLDAGLNGKAEARTPSGGEPEGTLRVFIDGKPPKSRVDPHTGKVIRSAPKL